MQCSFHHPLFCTIELNCFIHLNWSYRQLALYSGDLNTELVWYSDGRKEVGCLKVWFSNAIKIPDSLTI